MTQLPRPGPEDMSSGSPLAPKQCPREALIVRGQRIFAALRAQRAQQGSQIQMATSIAAEEDLGLKCFEAAVRKAAEEGAARLAAEEMARVAIAAEATRLAAAEAARQAAAEEAACLAEALHTPSSSPTSPQALGNAVIPVDLFASEKKAINTLCLTAFEDVQDDTAAAEHGSCDSAVPTGQPPTRTASCVPAVDDSVNGPSSAPRLSHPRTSPSSARFRNRAMWRQPEVRKSCR